MSTSAKTVTVAPRKRPQQKRSAQMVERILDAAMGLVQRQGVEGLTTVGIGEVAGLSVGSLYQYYPNKDAIVLDLSRRWLATFPSVATARLDAAIPTTWASFTDDFRVFLREIGQLYLTHRNLLPVVDAMYGKPGLDEIVRAHDANAVDLHARWLVRVNPSLDPAIASRLGTLILYCLHGCLTAAVRSPDEFELILGDLEAMHLALLHPHLALR